MQGGPQRRVTLEKLIVEKQQALRFGNARQSPDTSGHNRLEPDVSGQDRTEPDERADTELAATVKRLEDENMNLRIDNRAKEHVITMLRDERREIQKQFQEVSYRLGAAETRVAQLEAPRPQEQDDVQHPPQPPFSDQPLD